MATATQRSKQLGKVYLRPDGRGRFAWALVATGVVAEEAAFYWLDFRVAGAEPHRSLIIGMPLIATAWGLRAFGYGRIAALVETLSLLRIGGLAFFLLQFPMLALGAPLADEWLLTADRSLHFDWAAFARIFSSPTADYILGEAYGSFRLQGVVVLVFLCLTGAIHRAWQFLTAALGSLLVAVLLLSIFAADGSFVGCGLHIATIPYHEGACRYGSVIHGWKSGASHTVDDTMFLGLASFPSFHVAGAVLFVWAFWHTRFVRWIWLALNVAVAIGSIVIGGHYFVDIVGGLFLGALAIVVVRRLPPASAGIHGASDL